MCSDAVYRLADGVQVRRERFGLLFYDYRGPRLYFVPSGDLMEDRFFDGERTTRELVESVCGKHDWSRRTTEGRVNQILELLKKKGLIHEQPIR
ncbi:MAG: mycofactocin biosynthesis chaperone MftB [Desulfomonilaceae bacterium]